jgi:hypothetical protein
MTRKNIVKFSRQVGVYGRTSHHVTSHQNMTWNTWHEGKKIMMWDATWNVMWMTSHNISTYLETSFWRDSITNMGSYDINFCQVANESTFVLANPHISNPQMVKCHTINTFRMPCLLNFCCDFQMRIIKAWIRVAWKKSFPLCVIWVTIKILGFSNWSRKPNLDKGQKDPLSFWTSQFLTCPMWLGWYFLLAKQRPFD